MDLKVALARQEHHASKEADALARQHRTHRDTLLRQVYAEGGWSYQTLARAVGMSKDAVAKVIADRPRSRRTARGQGTPPKG